jgi:hypothetical protein
MNLRKSLVCAATVLALATLGACARDDADDDATAVAPSAPASDADTTVGVASTASAPAGDTSISTASMTSAGVSEPSSSGAPTGIGPGGGTLAPGNNLARADTNGDGLISRSEADADGTIGDRFTTLDTNGDGSLSSDEWLADTGADDTMR